MGSAAVKKLDLTRTRWVEMLLRSRWPQFLVRAICLAGFTFTILAGLTGTPVGNQNFAIIFVWIAWWSALKLLFIPFGGRAWCSLCPIPMPGEWLQTGGVLARASRSFGLGKRWPKSLKGNWLQAGGFLVIGLFSAVTLTTPNVTGLALLGLLILAIILSLVFERRAFCSYVCPIGGFTGLYAQLAPIELRVIDKKTCAAHSVKDCYAACPWGVYAGGLMKNTDCGLCMECLRVCPQENIAVSLRSFGADLAQTHPAPRLDETFLSLVMLGSAGAFAAVFTGPWGQLKTAAYTIGSLGWAGYALGFLGLNLVLLPGLFALAVWSGQKLSTGRLPLRQAIARQGVALVPLGMLAWIAFTVSFAFAKAGYILAVINDPLGWGWHLLGSLQIAGTPDLTLVSPLIQVSLLLIGLVWAGRTAIRRAERDDGVNARYQAIPVLFFILLYTLAMLWLLLR